MNKPYRGEVPRCPACGAALEIALAGSAEIDVCRGLRRFVVRLERR